MKLAVLNQYSSAGGGARFTRALVMALACRYPEDLHITLFTDAAALERDAFRDLFDSYRNVTVEPIADGSSSSRAVSWLTRVRCFLRDNAKRLPLLVRMAAWYRGLTGRRPAARLEFTLADELLERLSHFDVIYLAWPYFITPFDCGRPVVITTHDFNYKYPFGNFTTEMLQVLERDIPAWLQAAASVTVSTQFVADELERFYPGMASAVDVILLAHLSLTEGDSVSDAEIVQSFGLPADFVICASNTSRHKNLGLVLEAFGELKRRGVETHLVLAGFGTDRIGRVAPRETYPTDEWGRLSRIAAEQNLELGADYHALGYVSDEQIDALIRKSTLVVAPSRYEAGSGPALDAWWSGTPVAMSSIPPFVEQMERLGTRAWVFDVDDPHQLADAVDEALKRPDLRQKMTEDSKRAIMARQWSFVAEEYYEVFRRVESINRKSVAQLADQR